MLRPIGIAVCLFALAVAAGAQETTVAERLGYARDARLLVIQADIGMMHANNRAAFEALEKHWITSATILVPCPWFPEAAAFARTHPNGDYGIHLALNSEWDNYRWGPVSPRALVPSLVGADGYFPPVAADVVASARMEHVERELRAQIEKARAAGIRITHLDSHMETLFASPQLLDVYTRVGRQYGLPVLLPDGPVKDVQIGPRILPEQWSEWYRKRLSSLGPGVYQLTLHLGYDDEEARGATGDHAWGAAWRQRDWDLLRDPQFRQFLQEQKFVFVTWRELGAVLP